jgi:hypothetical protein
MGIDSRWKPFMKSLILLTLFLCQSALAQEIPERPIPPMAGGKQKLMEVHIRNDGYCTIYRIEVSNGNTPQYYLVNTCGGIIRENKAPERTDD